MSICARKARHCQNSTASQASQPGGRCESGRHEEKAGRNVGKNHRIKQADSVGDFGGQPEGCGGKRLGDKENQGQGSQLHSELGGEPVGDQALGHHRRGEGIHAEQTGQGENAPSRRELERIAPPPFSGRPLDSWREQAVKQGTGDLQGGECHEHKPIRVQWGQLEGSLVKGR